MAAMTVTLPPSLEVIVRRALSSGGYADADAVVAAALRRLDEDADLGLADVPHPAPEEESPEYQAYLRREIAIGIEQADRGEYAEFDAESVIREGMARLAAARERGVS